MVEWTTDYTSNSKSYLLHFSLILVYVSVNMDEGLKTLKGMIYILWIIARSL